MSSALVQPPGFEQDAVGYADLAYVVKRRGQLHRFGFLVGQADRIGDQARIARHADQVVAGLLVAELAGARQAQQRFLLAFADFLRGVLHHAFEQPLAVLERELLAPQRDQVAAAREALARVDRLDEEIGDPRVKRRIADLAVVVHGDHDHRHVFVPGQRAQALDEFDAVHVGHRVVDQHEVGNVLGCPDDSVHRTPERLHDNPVVQAAHDLLENCAPGRLVVDHHDRILHCGQNMDLGGAHAKSPPSPI